MTLALLLRKVEFQGWIFSYLHCFLTLEQNQSFTVLFQISIRGYQENVLARETAAMLEHLKHSSRAVVLGAGSRMAP